MIGAFFIKVIYMKIIAWMVLILNAIVGLLNFTKVFTDKTVEDRVSSFIGLIIAVLTIYLCIFVLRMI